MSIKIYNGFRFDKDYSLRELDNLLIPLKKEIQKEAERIFMSQILNEWLYVFDCYAFFGPEVALKRLNKYKDGPHSLDWFQVLMDIIFYIETEIRKSKSSYKRDFNYDYQSEIHIMPIKDKILFTYYGEKEEFEKILKAQSFIQEYHYQNQTDQPSYLTDEQWEERKNDWNEAMIDGIPSNHGFTVSFVNDFLFPFMNSEEIALRNPSIRSLEQRAKEVAYDIEYPCEKFSMSVMLSKEYKDFLKEQTEKVKEKLTDFKNSTELYSYILKAREE